MEIGDLFRTKCCIVSVISIRNKVMAMTKHLQAKELATFQYLDDAAEFFLHQSPSKDQIRIYALYVKWNSIMSYPGCGKMERNT